MSTEAFRAEVFGLIESTMAAAHPTVPIMYENGPVIDEAAVGNIFLDADIRWYGAQMVSMGPAGTGRDTGAISLQVYYKQAEGTQAVDAVIDTLRTAFKSKRIGSGVTKMPQRSVPTDFKGWYKSGLFVPFHLDTF
jgi:hypothetical protein